MAFPTRLDETTGSPVGAAPRGDSKRFLVEVIQRLPERANASLVAGIWEDTRQAISRNPQLLVLGPNTAEELAERGMDATRKAADYVLEASVRSVGDRIRVNTNLVRTDDGAQLWSENFDRRLSDVLELQTSPRPTRRLASCPGGTRPPRPR